MANLKLKYIIDFLSSRGWKEDKKGKRFTGYIAPVPMELPEDFRLELPNEDAENLGMSIYIDGLLNTLRDIYPSYKQEDFLVMLSNTDAILSTRIMDDDTKDGTIQLNKLGKIYDLQKKILKQAVSFLVTNQTIFGSAKEEADLFIENSRSLPTAKGSFITKIQLPSHTSSPILVTPSATKVAHQLFKTIDYIQEEIIKTPINAIDKSYISSHEKLINIELLSSINNFYKNAQVNNVEFSFYNNKEEAFVDTLDMLSKTSHIANFIRQTKSIIIQETPLRFTGIITKLNSSDPSSDNDNSITIEIEGLEGIKTVKAYLDSKQYKDALDAHSNKWKVSIEGLAKQNASQYLINYPDKFEILDS
jgi:hypothetical protein